MSQKQLFMIMSAAGSLMPQSTPSGKTKALQHSRPLTSATAVELMLEKERKKEEAEVKERKRKERREAKKERRTKKEVGGACKEGGAKSKTEGSGVRESSQDKEQGR